MRLFIQDISEGREGAELTQDHPRDQEEGEVTQTPERGGTRRIEVTIPGAGRGQVEWLWGEHLF